MEMNWTQFKNYINETGYDILMVETDFFYSLKTSPGPEFTCEISKRVASTDRTDFENNYKDTCNPTRHLFDTDGRPLSKKLITQEGWWLSCLIFSFQTGKYDSLHAKESDNSTNISGFTHKIYDSNNDEITSSENETNAVKTIIEYMPPFDFDFIGAEVYQPAMPTNDIFGYMVAVPDISEESGGSKAMCKGGFNFRCLGPNGFTLDGRATTRMNYNATYKTNKLQFLIYYPTYEVHDLMIRLEHYRE